MRGYTRPLRAPSTTPSIILGSETALTEERPSGSSFQALSDDEQEKTNSENEFQEIDADDSRPPSIIGGRFSTTSRGIKPQRVKSLRSWIWEHGFKINRGGVEYWKCKLCMLLPAFLISFLLYDLINFH